MNLRAEDAARLIGETHSENSVLIGGQAVSIWSQYFGIPATLASLTDDIDYLGTGTEARRASRRLKIPHKLKIATFEDNTPSSGLLSVELDGYPESILIDYLVTVIGVDSKAIEESAVVLDFEGAPLRIVHPLLLLQTKIWNLYLLERKRTPPGIEQARLSIGIVAAYLERARLAKRQRLKAIDSVGKFSATTPARYAARNFGLDCLKAVPPSLLREGALPKNFLEKRWPQILAAASRR